MIPAAATAARRRTERLVKVGFMVDGGGVIRLHCHCLHRLVSVQLKRSFDRSSFSQEVSRFQQSLTAIR
jgi:hypothetical protein